MKKTISLAILLALVNPGNAATDLVDTAKVISSKPIIERVSEPRQECSPVAAAPAPAGERSMTGAIVGGVAGAVVGSQVGRGSGKTAATAAGAVAGAIIGDRVDNRPTATPQAAQQCRTVYVAREYVKGYTVVYRYNGRDITTTLPSDPGSTVRVGVGVLDSAPAAGSPTPGMLGANVRDVRPAPPAPATESPPMPVSDTGGYNYRY
jgi:uncharacterized protein YcfJ